MDKKDLAGVVLCCSQHLSEFLKIKTADETIITDMVIGVLLFGFLSGILMSLVMYGILSSFLF